MRRQRFTPLIYGEPICKLHRSLYRGISACPTRNPLTLTYGLRLPACRILVTTISSQSRQETPVSKTDSNQHQDNEIPPSPAGDFILFILLTGAMIMPGILSPNPQNILSFIAIIADIIIIDIIIFFRLTTYLIKNKNKKLTRTPCLS